MSHSREERRRLLSRIHRLQGQLNGLKKLLETAEYDAEVCHDAMRLLASIKGATNGLTQVFLEGYVKDHLLPEASARNARAVDEFMDVIKTFRI